MKEKETQFTASLQLPLSNAQRCMPKGSIDDWGEIWKGPLWNTTSGETFQFRTRVDWMKRDEAHRAGLNVVQGNLKQNTTKETLTKKN